MEFRPGSLEIVELTHAAADAMTTGLGLVPWPNEFALFPVICYNNKIHCREEATWPEKIS